MKLKILAVGLMVCSLLAFPTGCDFICRFCPPLPPVQAEIYAVEVSAFNICTTNNNYCDQSKAEGPPDETDPWTGHFVSLGGRGGYIIATMGGKFTDGPGVDLRIYEVGSEKGGVDEPFDVFISSDGVTWIQVADDIRNVSGKIYSSIDITPNTGNYLYVKVVDESTQRGTATGTPGSDIDALEALWTTSPLF